MITILSALDERVRPKGSRDPLGTEAIWSHVGRRVVGHLTTVSSSLDNFIVALLCSAYANEHSKELDGVQKDFVKAEQVAAYLKLAAPDEGIAPSILGITRARRNFEKDVIPLGSSAQAELLHHQLDSGLWGLYSSPLNGVGLIQGANRTPTEQGRRLIQSILEVFGFNNWESFKTICQGNQVKRQALTPLATPFNAALRHRQLRHEVVEVLLNNQRGAALQTELYALANLYLASAPTQRSPQDFNGWVQAHTSNPDMRDAMAHMDSLEPLLFVAEKIFAWLQHEAHQPRAALEQKVTHSLAGLQLSNLWQQIPGLPHREFLSTLLVAINTGNGTQVIDTLLAHNKHVSLRRGGAPWLEFDPEQKLKVRVKNDSGTLPSSFVEDAQHWRNSYFLASFLNVIAQQHIAYE